MISVEHKAANPSWGLTVADLYQFLQEAERLGIDPRTPVKALVGFKRQVKSITVDGATDEDIARGVRVANDEIGKKQ